MNYFGPLILPVVERDEYDILLQQVVWSKEEASAASHDEGPAVEVDHHGALLGVQLGAVHVEVEAVLVPDGGVGGDVELGAEVPILSSVLHIGPGVNRLGWLKNIQFYHIRKKTIDGSVSSTLGKKILAYFKLHTYVNTILSIP